MIIRKATDIIYFLKQKGHIFFLSLLCLFSLTLQFLWLRLDSTPPSGDGIPFILRGMHFFQLQNKLGFWAFAKEVFSFNYAYPPLIDFTYFLYYQLFGLTSEMELMVNSLYLVIGIIGVYGIGKYLFNKNTGLLSALIFISLPGVLTYSKLGFKEFQLMCFLALTVYFLLESKNFTNRKFSVLFGISSGLMMMTKWEGFLFLIVPLTIVLVKIISSKTLLRNGGLRGNIGLILIIVFLIVSPWYILNWQNFFNLIRGRVGLAGREGIYFSTKDLTFYLSALRYEFLTGFYRFAFIIICICSLLKIISSKTRTKDTKRILLLCLYFAFPFLVFTFLCEKNFPHITPLLVFVSVIIAGGCSTIKNKFIKPILICLIFLHAVNTQLMSLLTVDCNRERLPLIIKLSPIDYFLCYKPRYYPYGFWYRVTKDNWDTKLKGMLGFIKEDYYGSMFNNCNSSFKKPSVLLLVNHEPLRYFQMEYYNMKEYSPIALVNLLSEDRDAEDEIFGDKYEYIITEFPIKFIHPGEDVNIKKVLKFINDNTERFHQDYQEVGEFELPRSSKAIIYNRISSSIGGNKSILQ